MSHLGFKSAGLAIILGLIPTLAVAQPDPKAEARAHYDRGVTLAKGQAYAEAVVEFNRAYQLSPNYAVLFNLGQAYVGMGQPVYAVDTLTRYLSEGGKAVPSSRRKQVEADIAQQERRIAAVTIQASQAGAVIRIDGIEVGRSPMQAPIRVNAGAHVFAAALAGYKPWEQSLELAGREQRTVAIVFEPLPAPASAPPVAIVPQMQGPSAPATAPPASIAGAPGPAPLTSTEPPATDLNAGAAPAPTTRSGRIAAYVVGGLGLASLATGTVFGIRAITKMDDSDKECPQEQCSQRGVDLSKEARTSALIADITLGAGLAAVGVATYLFLRSPKASTTTSGIQVAPEVGPNRAGVALGGVW
jgi:hypothetical protein